ncbi:TPA: tail assembly protein [Haemophilus influenzae]|uniref:tail assembly protein n=1 Tax=Haemophilus influenzae TaxID=727 RepID=UPI000D019880|nr:tail assembly protein [Haemophilus influenzae]AXP37803.1 tail assembly protein [Haemophilus influenzae]AXP56092.1 tail assembly protein [Haemophilus influenzae]AXP66347.1 tail assembly protein [Haemophilus influenzae]AYO34417.1 tail assembly protein [Haemophilus influenzae]MCK8908770.1 tail assembly protein [Haemophilus influenzae]
MIFEKVRLEIYGGLKRFSNEFIVRGDKLKEGMSALLMQLGEFREQIQKGKFHVIVGNNKEKELSEETIYANFDEELTENTTLHIMPVIRGAKCLGFLQIVVGAVLIAASWWAGGAAGWSYLGASGFAGATAAFFCRCLHDFFGGSLNANPYPKNEWWWGIR